MHETNSTHETICLPSPIQTRWPFSHPLELERQVVAAILRQPDEFLILEEDYCPCCVLSNPMDRFLVIQATHAAKQGRCLGMSTLAWLLWRGGPITWSGAQRYVAELMLEPDLQEELKVALCMLRLIKGPTRRRLW